MLERERLSDFASGVRGLIAALQAADEATKASVRLIPFFAACTRH
jgi:hypothetical protein